MLCMKEIIVNKSVRFASIHNAFGSVANIRVFQLSVQLRSLKSKSTGIFASNQDTLWDVRKFSITLDMTPT